MFLAAVSRLPPLQFIEEFFPDPVASNDDRTTAQTLCKDLPSSSEPTFACYKEVDGNKLPGYTFLPIHEKHGSTEKNRVWAAAWPNSHLPPREYVTARPTRSHLDPIHLCHAELPIICDCSEDSYCSNPLYEAGIDVDLDEAQQRVWDEILAAVFPIFRYQQRQFCYAILFNEDSAYVLRVDHVGIVYTSMCEYKDDATKLFEFLWRFAHASPAQRGWDPTAEFVPHDSDLGLRMRRRADFDKNLGPPGDYPHGAFEHSLKADWPWFKLTIGAGDSRREFLVGAPYFQRSGNVLEGLMSTGYVALAIDGSGDGSGDSNSVPEALVYLKDVWRATNHGCFWEGDTLERLNAAGVPYVPTLLCHSVVEGQTSLSSRLWCQAYRRWNRNTHPHLEHYRLVEQEVAAPLQTFKDSKALLHVLKCGITAHDQAMQIPLLHRDISEGNLLIWWNPDSGKYQGLLADWEHATNFTPETYFEGEPILKLGTSHFAAMRVLYTDEGERTAEDDLESFFHILLWCAIHFMDSNVQNIAAFLQGYFFDDRIHAPTQFPKSYRCRCIEEGKIRISSVGGAAGELRFATPPSASGGAPDVRPPHRKPTYDHPIDGLIRDILQRLHDYYMVHEGRQEHMPDSAPFSARALIDLLDHAENDPNWPSGDKRSEDRSPPDFKPERGMRPAEQRRMLPDDMPLPSKTGERPVGDSDAPPAAKRQRRG
ncbi:hypothetical protein C8Q77DRAFT_1220550 [Trametes polyzona]|nr:hypothetical protein C8Q77DRAFT_1220550 [Trametes polyzona]